MLIRLLDKVHRAVSAKRRDTLCAEVEGRVPGYEQFISDLTAAQAVGAGSHPWRALDILKVLDDANPQNVVELGSGSSTALFSHYVKANPGSALLSLDESETWAELTQAGLEKNGFLPHAAVTIRAAARVENDLGSYYNTDLPEEIDLLYIDGPSVKRTATGQLANQDVLHLFDRGIRPQAILIDRRHATVRAILDHKLGRDYQFTPSTKLLTKQGVTDPRHLLKFGALNFNSLFKRIQ